VTTCDCAVKKKVAFLAPKCQIVPSVGYRMDIGSILKYQGDPNEDYYQLLGCDRLSTVEQIQTEFKVRARECHPDKQKNITESNPERFQILLKAKNTLVDEVERKYYDAWLDSGISVSYAQWRGLNDTVKTSMHWAVPKKEKMLAEPKEEYVPPEVREEDDEDDDGVTYEPTPYGSLGYRVPSPVEEWRSETSGPTAATQKPAKTRQASTTTTDTATAQKRKQFATRRESSIGAMLMTNKFSDDDLRSKFRTYEI